jgi:hypothetical protein
MDTQKLIVGQKVRMVNGVYMKEGWVASVAPSGVEVQTGVQQLDGTWNADELFHFDNEGIGDYQDADESGTYHLEERA